MPTACCIICKNWRDDVVNTNSFVQTLGDDMQGVDAPEVILRNLGANYAKASEQWGVHVEVDTSGTGPIVTGSLFAYTLMQLMAATSLQIVTLHTSKPMAQSLCFLQAICRRCRTHHSCLGRDPIWDWRIRHRLQVESSTVCVPFGEICSHPFQIWVTVKLLHYYCEGHWANLLLHVTWSIITRTIMRHAEQWCFAGQNPASSEASAEAALKYIK